MKYKKIPMRMCVVTREKLPKKELIRIVKNKENEIFVDESGKQNGKGVYLKLDKEDGKAINTDTLSNQNDDNVNFEFNKVLLNNITKNTGSKENKLREINGQSVNINNINNSNVQSQEVYDDSYKNMDRNISFDNINQNTNIRADNIEFNPNIRIIDLSPYENNEEPFWDDFYEQ